MVVTGVRPAASLYAVTRSFLAWSATASVKCTAPVTVTSARPANCVPGCSPTSPVIVVGPVLVIVVPAKTAKLAVVPRFTGGWAAILIAGTAIITTITSVNSGIDRIQLSVFIGPFTPPFSTLHGRAPFIAYFITYIDPLPAFSFVAAPISLWSAPSGRPLICSIALRGLVSTDVV